MKLLITLVLFTLSLNLNAQFTLLNDISSGSSSGLSYLSKTVIGDKLYFKGTENGFFSKLWVTDGTPSGTNVIANQGTSNSYSFLLLRDEGIYYLDGTKLKLFNPNDNSLNQIQDFIGINVKGATKFGDKILVRANNTLYMYDPSLDDSYEIGNFSGVTYSLTITTSDSLAVLSNNGIGSFTTPIIENNGTTITPIKEYISPYRTVNSVDRAFIYENLLMLRVDEEENSQKYLIMDVNTKEIKDFTQIGPILGTFEKDGNIILLGEYKLLSINPNTLDYIVLNDDVSLFTNVNIYDDKVYFVAKDPSYIQKHYVSDGTIDGTLPLEGTDIGQANTTPGSVILNNKLYFTSGGGSAYTLKSYDLENETVDAIGTIVSSVPNGFWVAPSLSVLNDKIILSKHTGSLGNEPYVYDLLSKNTEPNKLNNINLSSNLQSNNLTIKGIKTNSVATIFDIVGKRISTHKVSLNNNIVNIENLTFGKYYIYIENKNGYTTLPFVRY